MPPRPLWSVVSWVVAVALVAVFVVTAGWSWWGIIFAVAIGLPVYYGSRRWARRHSR